MFGIETGKIKINVQGLNCHIPEPGYIYNYHKKIFEKTDIITTASGVWERKTLPSWYEKKQAEENKERKKNPLFIDEDLQELRAKEWYKRLFGVWFVNNHKMTYITGEHYMYLMYWWLGKSYPDYRDSDRRYFYFQRWVVECPYIYGMIDMEQRQSGKTGRSGLFLYEYTSRSIGAVAGCQSKSDKEAKNVIYMKGVVMPFLRLPEFFRPEYDKSSRLSAGIRFVPSIMMGSMQDTSVVTAGLGGGITYSNSKETAYDGTTLERYVGDEIFKTKGVNVRERHEVILPMLSPNGIITGKALYTTTVEEVENYNDIAINMWKDSDQLSVNINEGEKTPTGLVRFFIPSYENYRVGKDGFSNIESNKCYFLEERKKREGNPKILNSYIRKHAFTWQEAFRFSSSSGTFNALTLQDALDKITFRNNEYMRKGNFEWEEKDKKVVWQDNEEGRIQCVYFMDDRPELFQPYSENERATPKNKMLLSMGCDPFDHYKDSRYHIYSNGCAYVKIRHQEITADKYFNDNFFLQYLFRPDDPFEFFEDMIKICFAYSVPMLYEDQADAIRHHFEKRGYGNFLQWLPGMGKPGISASVKSKENMVMSLKKYFLENHQHYFKELLNQMFEFDIVNTRKYDAVMAAGYTLIAENSYLYKNIENVHVNKYPSTEKSLSSAFFPSYPVIRH